MIDTFDSFTILQIRRRMASVISTEHVVLIIMHSSSRLARVFEYLLFEVTPGFYNFHVFFITKKIS